MWFAPTSFGEASFKVRTKANPVTTRARKRESLRVWSFLLSASGVPAIPRLVLRLPFRQRAIGARKETRRTLARGDFAGLGSRTL